MYTELICTEKAFCDGRKRDRARFLALFVEIGNYLEVMVSLLDSKNNENDIKNDEISMKQNEKVRKNNKIGNINENIDLSGMTDTGSVIMIEAVRTIEKKSSSKNNNENNKKSKVKFTFHIKKIIAAISATKFLPKTHKLRVNTENGGSSSFIGAFNLHQKKKAINLKNLISNRNLNDERDIEKSGDDMWDSQKSSKKLSSLGTLTISGDSMKSRENGNRNNNDDDDDDIFATKTKKQKTIYKNKNKNTIKNDNNVSVDISTVKKEFNLTEEADEYLLQILSEILKVDISVLRQDNVKEEIDYVFNTWRRPHLLLDYYRMHSSTPEIQNNFRR